MSKIKRLSISLVILISLSILGLVSGLYLVSYATVFSFIVLILLEFIKPKEIYLLYMGVASIGIILGTVIKI